MNSRNASKTSPRSKGNSNPRSGTAAVLPPPRKSPRPRQGKLPTALLAPINADSAAPRFVIVDMKLQAEVDLLGWKNHLTEIRTLPRSSGALKQGPTGEPACLAPFLWLGDAAQARDVQSLTRLKIGAVLNVAGRDFGTKLPPYPARWDYFRVDLVSEFEAAYSQQINLLGDHFQRIYVFMERSVQSGKTIFVHCMTGMTRAPTICAAFLMLHFRWPLPKAVRAVLSYVPSAFEEGSSLDELIALARTNDLLVRDEQIDFLLEQAAAPAAELWRLAAGDSGRVFDRKKIIDAIASQCPPGTDVSEMDGDLAALEDRTGCILWSQFKRWFLVGQMKAES